MSNDMASDYTVGLDSNDGDRRLSPRYVAHMKSDKWRAIRDRVLARDGHICRGCLAAPAVQVHHLSYAHLGDELLFELVAICLACHTKAHSAKTSRRRRGGMSKLRDSKGTVIY